MWVSSPLCHPFSSWELSNQLKYSTVAKIFQVSSVKRKVNSDWVFISPKRFLISCLHDQCMHMQCNNFVSSFVHTLMWTHLSSNQSMCTSCLSMYVSHFSFYGELTSLLHWNKVHKEFTFLLTDETWKIFANVLYFSWLLNSQEEQGWHKYM